METSGMESVLNLIGLVGGPLAVIALTNHLRRATDWSTAMLAWIHGGRSWELKPDASPWPLVSDGLGVLWALGLWEGGLLEVIFPGLTFRWPVVVLIGLVVFGLGSSAVVDQKRAIVSRAAGSPPAA